eukprot:COSAG05_NODE_923_length_6573_cov_168.011725_10_plen_53_part_00
MPIHNLIRQDVVAHSPPRAMVYLGQVWVANLLVVDLSVLHAPFSVQGDLPPW